MPLGCKRYFRTQHLNSPGTVYAPISERLDTVPRFIQKSKGSRCQRPQSPLNTAFCPACFTTLFFAPPRTRLVTQTAAPEEKARKLRRVFSTRRQRRVVSICLISICVKNSCPSAGAFPAVRRAPTEGGGPLRIASPPAMNSRNIVPPLKCLSGLALMPPFLCRATSADATTPGRSWGVLGFPFFSQQQVTKTWPNGCICILI